MVFAIATPVIYVICEMRNWPLFTYHPGTRPDRLGWAPAVRDEGPAMYWYGWTATTLIGAAALGIVATVLPESVDQEDSRCRWSGSCRSLAVPILIYALRFFWRW